MRMGPVAANPDAYVAGLDGWRRHRVEALRAAVRTVGGTDEVIKWGHLVYLSNGPVLLIRAETPLFSHVLFSIYLGLFMWGGLWLRDSDLRARFPLRRNLNP